MVSTLQKDYYNYEKRFIYVDVFCDSGAKSSRWRRIKKTDVDTFAKEHHFYNVFATIQQFCVYKVLEGEEQYGPLYFDFDAKGNFKEVQDDVNDLLSYFIKIHNLSPAEYRVFFSGSKGMHVIVNPISMGIEPHPELTYIYKNMALYLQTLLNLKTLDPKVYSIRRVLRLPNTVHRSSGKYKIELDPSEILKDEAEIREMAKKPRPALYDEIEYTDLEPSETLNAFYKNFRNLYQKQVEINKLKPQKPIKKSEIYPVCIKDLIDNSITKTGTRNLATMCLACYFKDQDKTEQETIDFILNWTNSIPAKLTSAKGNQLKASTIGCIKSIFDDKAIGKNYHFICSAMRTLGTDCNYDKCKIANEKDQEPKKVIIVELSEASEGSFFGKKLSCKVIIVGKDTSPYLAPARIQLDCKKQGGPDMTKMNQCANCPIGQKGGRDAFDLPKTAQFILETINCSSLQQMVILKKLYGNARCPKLKIDILEYRNIEEVELNPAIEAQKESDGASEYVARKGYFIGHKLDVNQEFNIVGFVIPDPKTQHVVHIFDEANPSETSLTSFKMTPNLKKELEVFQVGKGHTVAEKFDDIYDDLERNILHIWQRRAMITTMDLVYHSVLRFRFQGSLLTRGWLEAFIIGDTSQGKSDLFLKLSNHYNLGMRVSGEGSRRTGLAWTWQQTANHWFVRFGTIPNNDRRLICIDEAAGIDEEQLEKLTDMRTSGIADATGGPIPAKAHARTRLLWMSNARTGQTLRTFMFPVEAIQSVFRKSEDIRRLDFAIGVVTGTVDDKVIHQNAETMAPVEHKYTSDLSHSLVLWAWTRKPDNIIINNETNKVIQDAAMYFGRTYSARIPLVESAVQRIKIARMAVAVAARVFSADETGEKVIVLPEHVKFVTDFLKKQYNDPIGLDYLNYTTSNRLDSTFVYDDAIEDYVKLQEVEELNRMLMTTKYWSKNDLGDMLGYDRETLGNIIKVLYKHRLIEKAPRGQYRMSTAGIDFVKRFSYEIKNKLRIVPFGVPENKSGTQTLFGKAE